MGLTASLTFSLAFGLQEMPQLLDISRHVTDTEVQAVYGSATVAGSDTTHTHGSVATSCVMPGLALLRLAKKESPGIVITAARGSADIAGGVAGADASFVLRSYVWGRGSLQRLVTQLAARAGAFGTFPVHPSSNIVPDCCAVG